MSIIHKPFLFGRTLRLSVVMGITAYCAVLACAQTEDAASPDATPPPPPYALLQYSTLTGSGNSVTANWVPVVTSKGTIYKNLTLLFDVDSSGNLTVAPNYPKVVLSPSPIASSFIAGKYVGPSTICNSMIVTVSGPAITAGGATEWSLVVGSGAGACTYPYNATWYVGPPATNPLVAARLKKVGITSTNWSYGVGGTPYGGDWTHDSLLGFSQIGKTLTIVSFTDGSGDHNEPVDTIVYTLSQ